MAFNDELGSSLADARESLLIDERTVSWNLDLLTALADARSLTGELSSDAFEGGWPALVDRATSLVEASQWALLIDSYRARQLMSAAAEIFRAGLGHGYGYFLRVAASGDVGKDADRLVYWILATSGLQAQARPFDARGLETDLESLEDNNSMPHAMAHPQQQAYGLLALAGDPTTAERFRAELSALVMESSRRNDVVPMGALGTPVGSMWRIGAMLISRDAKAYSEAIVRVLRRYSENVQVAQSSAYLWRTGLAPIDVVDTDIVGLIAIGYRNFGSEFLALIENQDLDRVARSTVQVSRIFMTESGT